MASRTQIRLQQLTGSLVDLKTEAQQYGAPATAAALTGSDLQDVLGAFGAALNRIHGAASDEPFNAPAGVFNQNITITGTTPKITIGDAGAENTALVFDGNAQDFYVGLDDTDDKLKIGLGSSVGTTPNITLNSADRDVAFAGDITVGGGKVTLTNGSTIDSETGGTLLLTEDLVKVSGDIVVGGQDIKSADGTTTITLTNDGDATIAGDLTVSGNDLDFSAGAANIGASVGSANLTLGGSTTTVVVAGNLDINGTTTTIDTVNLSVQDSIIALGVSGSGNYSTVGDRGILFPRGAAGSAVAGFFFDGTNFNLGSSLTGPTSGSFETVAAADFSALKLGNLLPGADDTYDLGSSTLAWKDLHLEGDILLTDAGKVETTAGDLTISSAAGSVILDAETDIVLDANGADVFLKDNGQIFSSLSNGTNNALVLSGGFAGGNIHLDSNGGVFALQAGGLNMNAIELESTGMKIGLFDGSSGNFNAGFLQLKDSNGNPSILSGTVGLRLDSGAVAASIQLLTDNHDSNFIALKAPDSVGSPVTFTLPGADGTSNQALITNGSGTLSFKSFGSDAIRKGIFVQSATLSAGADLQVSNVTPAHGDAIAIDNVSATQGRALDVYVNGQLLISGSAAARTANPPTVDYEIAAVSPQSILKFSFDLEADDVVQVIKRG